MEDGIFEHSITFYWVCFAGKMPASNIWEEYRILWVQEDERRASIFNPAEKKIWMQQGLKSLNLWLQGERPAPKPLNHEDLYILRAPFFHLAELATSQFWLYLYYSRRPKQTLVKYASLIYELGATKLSFFLQQWPQKAFSLSLDVKCDQQTHQKNDVCNYGTNLKKIIQHSPITILPMFLAGEFPHKIEAFFCWVWFPHNSDIPFILVGR